MPKPIIIVTNDCLYLICTISWSEWIDSGNLPVLFLRVVVYRANQYKLVWVDRFKELTRFISNSSGLWIVMLVLFIFLIATIAPWN